MKKTPTANLLAIGNELLNGEIQDTNLFTLARRLTHLGVVVEQALLVRDHPPAIVATLAHLWRTSPPDLLCISGGLGPTDDDLTLQAVAQALNRPLLENAEARSLVESQYDRLLTRHYLQQRGPEAARRKMSTLPEGGKPLPNPLGTAPGVRLEHQQTLIYCLPGVPAELEAIFTGSIAPEIRARFPSGVWIEAAITAQCADEAAVAAVLHEITARHADVYLKSLARPFPEAGDAALRIIAATHAPTTILAHQRIDAALNNLCQALQQVKISCRRVAGETPFMTEPHEREKIR